MSVLTFHTFRWYDHSKEPEKDTACQYHCGGSDHSNGVEESNMLSKPVYGWTDFQLEGTSSYSLSYLDDIPFEWVGQAIHGLETMLPFTVKGFLEPARFLCTVSYWNCHIVREDDERYPLDLGDPLDLLHELSHTSMLQFCRNLYEDISQDLDAWLAFYDTDEERDLEKRKRDLTELLARLKDLIVEREACFGENRAFL